MLKPGGFLKKIFNPGNVAGKVGKAFGGAAKATHRATMGAAKAPAKIFGNKNRASSTATGKAQARA